MADVQKQFEEFHATIRIDYDMSKELCEKRDKVVNKIKKYLKHNDLPMMREPLLQGSYKMKTGVKPIADLEYDIDIGLRFNIDKDDYTASEARSWVYDAVKEHTKRIEDKGPCIRVVYEKGFHLDLVVYAVCDEEGAGTYRLAHKKHGWRDADPPRLSGYVNSYRENFNGTEDSKTKTDQFRRCIRSLRRWNDTCIPYESDHKPTGLSLVLLAIQRGLAKQIFIDGRPDDRLALAELARRVSDTIGRIEAKKPTPEYEEMFSGLSSEQMEDLKDRFRELADTLKEAGETADPVVACEKLQKVFGEDFPVPETEDTGEKTAAPAIITSSSSA
jgi:hypothetical protein